MQKIRRILRAVSEKTALLTNQPVITKNTDLIGPGSRRSKNKNMLQYTNTSSMRKIQS